jgi:hypothetical protein
LNFVDLSGNQLPNLALPPSPQLAFLQLANNNLTSLTLPAGMTNLGAIFLQSNQLTNLTLSPGLTNLVQLDLRDNNLTKLILPPDLTRLSLLLLDGNPLDTLVVSEPMAAARLAGLVASLRNQGVAVFTFPLALRLASPGRTLAGAFEFTLTGPPGFYAVLVSSDLAAWDQFGAITNELGSAVFTDATLSPQKFYRARALP